MLDRRFLFVACFFTAAAALSGCAGSAAEEPASADGQELDQGATPADWIVCNGEGVSVYLWRGTGEVFSMRIRFGSEQHDVQVHRYREWLGVFFLDVVGSSLSIMTAGSKTTETDDPWTSAPFPSTLHFRVDSEATPTSYALQCRGPGAFMPLPKP